MLYVYDEEQAYRVRELAALTGATVIDDLVPEIVTHVVTLSETPHLSQVMRTLQTQAQRAHTSGGRGSKEL